MPNLADKAQQTAPVPGTYYIMVVEPGTKIVRRMLISDFISQYGGGGGDIAPTVVSCTCPNAAPNTLVYVFSQSMTAVTVAGHTAKKNGAAWNHVSVTGSGTTWTFTMPSAAVFGDTLLRSYDSTTGATIGTSLELVSFTDSAVTNSISGSGYQTESDAYFAANTGLSTPQKDAIDDLVVALKAIGWSKFKAVYPFIGATANAASFKWNLINPADTDGAFRITFAGTNTYNNVTGLTCGGTPSDYGDTKLNPSTALTNLNTHISVRITSASYSGTVVGAITNGGDPSFRCTPYTGGDTYYMEMNSIIDGQGRITNNDGTGYGLNVLTRTSGTVFKYFKDNVQKDVTSTTSESVGLVNTSLYIGAAHDTVLGAQNVNAHPIQFISIGDGLTDGEVASLTTAEATYQAAISRTIT